MPLQAGAPPSITDDAAGGCEYLTFFLGDEEYAIDILRVQEIRGYDPVTPIAGTPAFIKGVANLRGTIVPIADLRIKFGVGGVEYTPFTVVIILNIGLRVVGIVVDSVSDVVSLPARELHPAAGLSASIGAGFLRGLGTVGERMLIVLDIERMMRSPDMGLVDPDDAG
ncbi:chemotaxis protein CheW [Denitromonas iodatirespirans]|uniref:Chemotaxis protein CheW n=1 Tax=Denitromonas iodatirespirans TaxID=2795389 RepID=A0A944DBQ3_DENI1|nr:chemotaxis protein CheW [Denitromonas iodatirespirans]MBT0963554.1 chemotaxis protein CheW [Denitromonas iodatirespirans]